MPLRPIRKSSTGSRYIDSFVTLLSQIGGPSLASKAPTTPLSYPNIPPTPLYPLKIYDEKKKLLSIDKLAYYSGTHREALNLACLYYQRRILGVFAFPEALESDERLFNEECSVIRFSLVWAYYKLGLHSYQDTVFRLTHQFGMFILVSLIWFIYQLCSYLFCERSTNLAL